jgi:hypothetical protein
MKVDLHFVLIYIYIYIYICIYTVAILSNSQQGFGLDIGFTDHLRIITTSNCNNLMKLHTPNITVNAAHIKSSQSSLITSW